MNTRAIIEDESARDFLLRQIKLGRMQPTVWTETTGPEEDPDVRYFSAQAQGHPLKLKVLRERLGNGYCLVHGKVRSWSTRAAAENGESYEWASEFIVPHSPNATLDDHVRQAQRLALARFKQVYRIIDP